jgi:hypothetical protein
MVMITVWLADTFAASVTWKVTEMLPKGPVGMPVSAPVLLFKLNPAGSVPEVMVHVYGLVPPDTLNVQLLLHAVPAVAVREVVVRLGGGLTLICKLAVLVVSVIEVAVTVAVIALVTEAGAW